ncbi:MAG TPA: flagellar hook-associated protein FlgL [Ilumatobacteraceae bacterium]|nr:flagellar hook-associated protein FlgL [Ilumatobacteraceae bacterium]
MRVTNSMMVRSTLRDLNLSYARLARTQEQLSSGRALVRASDEPSVAADAMRLRALTRRSEQYARSLDDAHGLLGSADGALTSSLEVLGRAKELAVRAGNSGGLSDPGARAAIAIEIRSIRDDLVALANTRHGDRSVFAGNASGAAYNPTTGSYTGDAGAVRRDVAANTSVQVNVTGPEAFGVEGGPVGNVFEVLERMAQAVANADGTALATEHANLDVATARLGVATVQIGSRAARMNEIQVRAEDDQLRLRTLLSEAEDVDIVEALVNAKAQENAYQAALQVAAKIIPMSLLDYLR